MLSAKPGDVILVARRSTFKSWVCHPISSLISARIRSSTGSKWSHVACYVGSGYVVEAEWNKGVVRTHFASAYDEKVYEWKVVSPPKGLDTDEIVTYWNYAWTGKMAYDYKALVAMRVSAILWGHAGIRRYVHDSEDSSVVCSELASNGWKAGGMHEASYVLISPGDFDQDLSGYNRGVDI